MNELDQLLAEILDEHAGVADDVPFADTLGWDSLKHAELVIGIERRFGVELSRDDIARMTSTRAVRSVLGAKGHDI